MRESFFQRRILYLFFALSFYTGQSNANQNQILISSGLHDRVEILRDRWGIPHIYANNQADLFFAQGYIAAQDYLFQFELWRRRAMGLLAEIQGEKAVDHDIGARLLKFRGNIRMEMRHYHDDGEEIIESFVKGVNAYIDLTKKKPELLPVEFALLDITPGYWTPEVVISRHSALRFGANQELTLAEMLRTVGEEKTRQLIAFNHTPYLKAQTGVDLNDLSEDILNLYKAARYPPRFGKEDVVSASEQRTVTNTETYRSALDPFFGSIGDANAMGSNNWVISGAKTASGYPIMANDPHRSIQVPPLRSWVHLVAPGWNVIGGTGESTLPGVAIGHNGHGAWGLTIFFTDQEDIYVYETNPENTNQYRYQDSWEDMQIVVEEIPVKNQNPKRVTLKYTRHGPVLFEDDKSHRAYALRASWLETGGAPYLASLRIAQARNWQAFRKASTYFGLPGENIVWADRAGNIGWQAVGLTPIRIGWDGLLPVPGDGRFEWAGYVPGQSMPHVLNPKQGYWATANQNNIPESYPNIYSFFGVSHLRHERITSILAADKKLRVEDSKRLQHDELSLPAARLVPLLETLDLNQLRKRNDITATAIDHLLQWDYVMEPSSIAAAIYARWENELQERLLKRFMSAKQRAAVYFFFHKENIIDWLTSTDDTPNWLLEQEPVATKEHLLISSLGHAIEQLVEQLGSDVNVWQYGQKKNHHTKIEHPLSHLVDMKMRDRMDLESVPKGGDDTTVNLSAGGNNRLIGASFRIIVDTSDWDLTVGTNVPGQSGDPDSPYYDSLLKMWAAGEYFPAYYSRNKVESVTKHRTVLSPE